MTMCNKIVWNLLKFIEDMVYNIYFLDCFQQKRKIDFKSICFDAVIQLAYASIIWRLLWRAIYWFKTNFCLSHSRTDIKREREYKKKNI